MFEIDVNRFVEELVAEVKRGEVGSREVVRAASKLEEDCLVGLEALKSDRQMADTLLGRRILSHHYGELAAIRFRTWIESNYEIGRHDGEYLPC